MDKKVQIKNGKELLIREAVKSDAAGIIEYLNKLDEEKDNLLFLEEDITLSVKEEEKIINNFMHSENQILCLGLIDNEIVSVSKLSSSERERVSHISNFAISIKRELWNLGIGTAITTELINFAKESKVIKTINLMVNTNNESGINLYKKMGFEEVGVFKDYFYINGEYLDSIIMNKYL